MKYKLAILSIKFLAFILIVALSFIFGNYIPNTVIILLLIIIILTITFDVKRNGDRLFAAQNALLAKYTFSTLDPNKQNKVINKTNEILQRGGIEETSGRINKMTERTRYSFYALAMDEIGIKPAFEEEEWWVNIKNPFIALINADREIKSIQSLYRKMYGLDITLE
jgi:hypothetical protein